MIQAALLELPHDDSDIQSTSSFSTMSHFETVRASNNDGFIDNISSINMIGELMNSDTIGKYIFKIRKKINIDSRLQKIQKRLKRQRQKSQRRK
jgi:hypothetical protein